MNIQEVIQSSNIWQDIFELFQDPTYGVITLNDISELGSDLINGKKSKIDDVNGGESWNESIQRLQAAINDAYNTNGSEYQRMLSKGARGDAGANYYGTESGDEWVEPNINVDNDKYGDVRGNDKILAALNFDNESQFTINKITGNICRLIMPKYTRRVEVEDLNRNFWVIAQVISAICDDIFWPSTTSRFEILHGIIDEITQLWENIVYLWAAAKDLVAFQAPTVTLWEQIPISHSTGDLYLGYKNYDGFDLNWADSTQTSNADGLSLLAHLNNENHLKYYFGAYPRSNCAAIPIVRANNYKENFYSQMIFPGLIFHNYKTGINYIYDFVWYRDEELQNLTKEELKEKKNLVFVDMEKLAIRTKYLENNEIKYKNEYDFIGNYLTGTDTQSDLLRTRQSWNGLYYHTLMITPTIKFNNFSDILALEDKEGLAHGNAATTELFVLKTGKVKIHINGRLFSLAPQRITPMGGYRMGFINLSFGDVETVDDRVTPVPYLGDVVSYYAD